MKSVAEMKDLRAAFAFSGSHIFAHLPIHRRLQTILDRERAAFDEEVTRERRKRRDAGEGFDKFCVGLRVNIRVRDLHCRGPEQLVLHRRFVEMRMIITDRNRAKKSVEIDQAFAGDRVVNVRTAAAFEIENNLEAIHQDVLFERLERVSRAPIFIRVRG